MDETTQLALSEELHERLSKESPGKVAAIDKAEAAQRLDRMAGFCPVYRNFLRRNPGFWPWLEKPANRDTEFRPGAYTEIWSNDFPDAQSGNADAWLRALQRFRRAMCMRIAYREINGIADIQNSLRELTHLAEFCLGTVVDRVLAHWTGKLGQPWDENYDRPARFCVIGLGKLGGGELNFCSDLDLVYLYQGQGSCRKQERGGSVSNDEFYGRVCRDITNRLQSNSDEGFLYHVDLRLRPEGDSGPIVRALSAMESYYAAAGQTWERLALMKARSVAGSIELGDEFFETVNSFRHPTPPPPSLLEEIVGLKLRIEKEVLGDGDLERNIKTGYGGIRELEFYIQALQIAHCGRNPFLQTPSTLDAIQALERYELLDPDQAERARTDYLFLRTVEHRLQMREEKQTHTLPVECDTLAANLGFADPDEFSGKLKRIRDRINRQYADFFQSEGHDRMVQDWTLFFSGKPPSQAVKEQLRTWFWGPLEPVEQRLRHLILGGSMHNLLTREHVILFLEIADQFNSVLPPLAHPMNTLERLNHFAERYGARKQFLKMCAHQPNFFKALCLLFDRSRFIHELLSRHPEIMEEIFLTGLRKAKPIAVIRDEIARLPQDRDDELARFLWLYVRAEQVRVAIVGVLASDDPAEIESSLTDLADAALLHVMERVDPEGELAAIALGKYGGAEIVFGSDLDLLILASEDAQSHRTVPKIRRFLALLGHKQPEGRTFEVDLRLRPHGNDGPLAVTIRAFHAYHRTSAQTWEKQLLTRARVVGGNEQCSHSFVELRNEIIYSRPLARDALPEIDRMRRRIAQEKVNVTPPERAFKAGPGGIIDIEFFVQTQQLLHGAEHPGIREPNTRKALRRLCETEILNETDHDTVRTQYDFLRTLEQYLRRDRNRPVTEIGTDPDEHVCIAKWLDFPDYEAFWEHHKSGMRRCHACLERISPLADADN